MRVMPYCLPRQILSLANYLLQKKDTGDSLCNRKSMNGVNLSDERALFTGRQNNSHVISPVYLLYESLDLQDE